MIRHLFFLIFLMCSTCSAGCYVNSYTADHSNAPDITVNRDVAVGTLIGTYVIYGSGKGNVILCNGGGNNYLTMKYNGGIKTSIEHVYSTNIPGVGIMVKSSGGRFFENPGYNMNGGSGISDAGSYTVNFYKTGNITPGNLVSGIIAAEIPDTGGDGVDLYIDNTPSITQLACETTTGNSLSFPIGDVLADQFKAMGTVSKQNNTENLGLNCDAGANINVTFNGTQNPDSTDPSILALSPGSSVATGVGVQLLYNNQPLQLNKLLNLKTSTGGQESFPITARYIQIKDTVTPGTANATATLNITYQ